MKNKSLRILKSFLCQLFWYLFIVQALILLYLLAPKPSNPMVMVPNDFVTIDGPNIIQEGNANNTYTLRVTQNLNQDLNVTLKYSGTAQKDKDYIAPQYVTIEKGKTSVDFNITVVDDPFAELNDAFAVRILTINGETFLKEYNVSNASNVIFTKILDEKPPKYADNQTNNISITGADTIDENNQTTQYTLTLSQPAIEDIDLNLSYKGSAQYGIDYTAPKQLRIHKGAHEAKFTIKTIDDIYKEYNETIDVFISGLDDIGFEDIRYNKSHFTISLQDETPPSQALHLRLHSPKQAMETSKITYKIIADEAVIQDVKLPFSLLASDHNIEKDTLFTTLQKGKKEATLSLIVPDDNILEKKQSLTLVSQDIQSDVYEHIIINMKDNTTQIIDNPHGREENAATITLSSQQNSISEDAQVLNITIASSQTLLKETPFVITYDGVAKNGVDFQGATEAIIPSGHKSTTFMLKPINDNILEGKESFTISLKATSNGGLEKINPITPLTMSIVDEAQPSNKQSASVSLWGPAKIAEATDGNYTIHISQKLEADLKVALHFIDNTAKASVDFQPVTTIIIPKGVQKYSFALHTIDNTVAQTLRDFQIKIKNIQGGGLEKIAVDTQHNSVLTAITDKVDIENAFKRIVASKKIIFAYAKADVDPASFPILNDIAALLIQFPSVDLIVEGHTNSSGNRYRNRKLSKRRAKSVADYLIAQGVDKKRISSVGYGQSRPMVPDSNPRAQEINKRVEFKVKYRNIQ